MFQEMTKPLTHIFNQAGLLQSDNIHVTKTLMAAAETDMIPRIIIAKDKNGKLTLTTQRDLDVLSKELTVPVKIENEDLKIL